MGSNPVWTTNYNNLKMENFNVFDPMLKQGKDIGDNCIILAKRGNLEEYERNHTHYGGEKMVYGIDIKRKTESEKMSKAEVFVYYTDTKSITWKCTYIDNKGVYFKKDRSKIYLKKFA